MNNFLNKTFTTNSWWIGIATCIILINASCKENTILPPDLVPGVDNINTFQQDTFTVISHTVFNDSFLTGGKFNTTNRGADPLFSHAIGAIANDAVYGRTVGSSYIQVRQPSPNFTFSGINQIIDSVVVAINYERAYGDTSTAPLQEFFLARTFDNLSKDSAYYEFSNVNFSLSNVLSSYQPNFNTIRTDSPTIAGAKLKPQLRFKLPNSFNDSLLTHTSTGVYADYSSFLSWLGGFYIYPDSTKGATLGYFDTDNTVMQVYYRFTENGVADTAVALFPFDPTYCNRFNRITRNYAGKTSQNFISTGKPEGDSIIFLEGEPGLAGLITFPFIGSFPNAIINKAELTLTVVSPFSNYFDTTSYNIPPRMQIIYVNENGEEEILEDYLQVGVTRVGGFRSSFALAGFQRIRYTFNISHTIQNAVTLQNSNFALKISGVQSNSPGSGRVIVRGSGSGLSLEKPKLNIIFTKIQR